MIKQHYSLSISVALDRQGDNLVAAAEQLRLASKSLAKVVGKIDVDNLLDVIFRDFCIGK